MSVVEKVLLYLAISLTAKGNFDKYVLMKNKYYKPSVCCLPSFKV